MHQVRIRCKNWPLPPLLHSFSISFLRRLLSVAWYTAAMQLFSHWEWIDPR